MLALHLAWACAFVRSAMTEISPTLASEVCGEASQLGKAALPLFGSH